MIPAQSQQNTVLAQLSMVSENRTEETLSYILYILYAILDIFIHI